MKRYEPGPGRPTRRMALFAVLLAAACSDPVVTEPEVIRVASGQDAFTVVNVSWNRTLAVVIVHGKDAPLILLAPCDTWPDRIAPGRHRTIPYDSVVGDRSRDGGALVFWCQLVRGEVVKSGSLDVEYGSG